MKKNDKTKNRENNQELDIQNDADVITTKKKQRKKGI